MACSLSAMAAVASVQVGTMAAPFSSGLSFKDGRFLGTSCNRDLRSFGRPSPSLLCRSSPVATKTKPVVLAKAVDSSIGNSSSWNSGNWKQLLRPLVFNPLEGENCKKNRKRTAGPIFASAAEGGGEELPEKLSKSVEDLPLKVSQSVDEAAQKASVPEEGLLSKRGLTTGSFFFAWYFLNVIFNILNKKLYNYFPFPYFVSVVHLFVGVVYCLISWAVGAPKRAPIDKDLWLLLTPVAICHALGHIMSNVSFAAVAVSFTHTIKALEPFFNAAASQFILGEQIPVKLWLSLAPIVLGVSAASMTELSFNWTGFISAMTANVAFTYRNIYSKKAMIGMDSTNVYAYISILSLALCIPPAIIIEGPALVKYGFSNALDKVGIQKFLFDLFWVGMFYHLYNQLANNTLERVAPLTHAVGNVLKRVFVIGFTIVVFGNKITTQTGIGTAVAISGVAVYSIIKADIEEKKRAVKKAEGL